MAYSKKGLSEELQKKLELVHFRYSRLHKLGSGSFGTAWVVRDTKYKISRDTKSSDRVLKEITVNVEESNRHVAEIDEARILSVLNHPCILLYFDSFWNPQDLVYCIVTEYCRDGDLAMQIAAVRAEGDTLSESQIVMWTTQSLLALEFIHARNILHRDLKPQNIFLSNNMVKIGDFGISRILMNASDLATTRGGTPYYISPEALQHHGYNSKADVWSLGCVVFELCALRHAFEGHCYVSVYKKIVHGKSPKLPERYSANLSKLCRRLLKKDPFERLSASHALKSSITVDCIGRLDHSMANHKNLMSEEKVQADVEELAATIAKKKSLDKLHQDSEEAKKKNLQPRERRTVENLKAAEHGAQKPMPVLKQKQEKRKQSADSDSKKPAKEPGAISPEELYRETNKDKSSYEDNTNTKRSDHGEGNGSDSAEDATRYIQMMQKKHDPFDSASRSKKIEALKSKAIEIMGKEKFANAHAHFEKAIFRREDGEEDDNIKKEIKLVFRNPDDFYILDQLLCLEFQATD